MSNSELAATYSSLKERFKLTDQDLSKPVSDILLDKISSSLALKWKRLPAYLDLENTIVENIKYDPNLVEESEKRHQFLLDWKATKRAAATYESLILSLLQMKCRQDAETVFELLQENPDSGTQLRRAILLRGSYYNYSYILR